jgi:hypothetical protein
LFAVIFYGHRGKGLLTFVHLKPAKFRLARLTKAQQ